MKATEKTITPVTTEILVRYTFDDGSVLEECFGRGDLTERRSPPRGQVEVQRELTPSTNGHRGPVEGKDYELTKRGGMRLLGFEHGQRPTPAQVRASLPYVGEISDNLRSLTDKRWTNRDIAMHISMHPKWTWSSLSAGSVGGLANLTVVWQWDEKGGGSWAVNTRSLVKLAAMAVIVKSLADQPV